MSVFSSDLVWSRTIKPASQLRICVRMEEKEKKRGVFFEKLRQLRQSEWIKFLWKLESDIRDIYRGVTRRQSSHLINYLCYHKFCYYKFYVCIKEENQSFIIYSGARFFFYRDLLCRSTPYPKSCIFYNYGVEGAWLCHIIISSLWVNKTQIQSFVGHKYGSVIFPFFFSLCITGKGQGEAYRTSMAEMPRSATFFTLSPFPWNANYLMSSNQQRWLLFGV